MMVVAAGGKHRLGEISARSCVSPCFLVRGNGGGGGGGCLFRTPRTTAYLLYEEGIGNHRTVSGWLGLILGRG